MFPSLKLLPFSLSKNRRKGNTRRETGRKMQSNLNKQQVQNKNIKNQIQNKPNAESLKYQGN